MPEPADPAPYRGVPVRWGLSAHGRRLLTLALAGLAIAVITRRPEFVALSAPALLLLASWHGSRPGQLAVRTRLLDVQTIEDADSAVLLDIGGQGPYVAEIELEPADLITASPRLTIPPDAPSADETAAGPRKAQVRHVRLPFSAGRWGYRPIGLVTVTLSDRYRVAEGIVHVSLPWTDCRPDPAQLRSTLVLSKLPSRLGEHPARATGDGVEFAGIREFVPGDRQRRVNWSATTRYGSLHLSTFSAERIQNIVVIADATTDVGEPGHSSLDLVLRGVAGTVQRYLAARDRVGLIVFGSKLSWIGPGQGRRHLNRLLQLLVSTPSGWERTPEIARLPRAALPPGSLVLVFSPLLDPRILESLRDLRERGFPVVVVDVLNAGPEHDGSRMSSLTGRLWRLEQDAVRFSMTELGVPVVHWDGVSSLDDALMPFSRRTMVVRT